MSVKAGVLFKKGSGQGLFPRRNWKPRHCTLTHDALRYYDCQDGRLKGQIDLTHGDACVDLMPADCPKTGQSAASVWRIAIQTPTRRFFVAAPTEREMHDWAAALALVVKQNNQGHHSQLVTGAARASIQHGGPSLQCA
ncbi:Aste57867_12600 [Aphanomyces stellatus]|uniref:Aste57867_12600 protein n=1 Tax=Aphanomyces stellatus TaxID=120398 RepID=A0A485KWF0_9STRA|nr:hypothetical protein As57867_012554 [Aphanomyces stellatus]VFT89451.1 Aste57867_12600 [Aphanomyces stellatus]